MIIIYLISLTLLISNIFTNIIHNYLSNDTIFYTSSTLITNIVTFIFYFYYENYLITLISSLFLFFFTCFLLKDLKPNWQNIPFLGFIIFFILKILFLL